MIDFVLRRVVQLVPVLLLVSLFVFAMLRLVPGDPALVLVGENASPEEIQQAREQLGLTGSPVEQYLRWMRNAVLFDFGNSFRYGIPVTEAIRQQLEPTVQLAVAAYLYALVVGIIAGVYSARSTAVNYVTNAFAAIAVGFPTFVLGILLLVVFSVKLGWLPSGGYVSITEDPWEALRRLVLPTVALGSVTAAVLLRFVRTAMREALGEDYVRTARAKGLPERVVVSRHALRNALIPVITISAVQLGALLAGALVVEQVFARPGLGRLLVSSIEARDYMVVQAVMLLLVTVFVAANLAADLLYGVVDPRVRR